MAQLLGPIAMLQDLPAPVELTAPADTLPAPSVVPTPTFGFGNQSGGQAALPALASSPAPSGFSRRFPNSLWRNNNPMREYVDNLKKAESDDDKEAIMAEAKAALEEHYDQYIEGYQEQVDQLEKRLAALKEQLQKRKEARDPLVNMKLQMLSSEASGLGWPDEGGSPRSMILPLGQNSNFRLATPNQSVGGLTVARPIQPTRADSPDAPAIGATTLRSASQRGNLTSTSSAYRGVKSLLSRGTKLLQANEYEAFLKEVLSSDALFDQLQTASFSEVVDYFSENEADFVLDVFKAANGKSPFINLRNKTVVWKLKVDDQKTELVFNLESGKCSLKAIPERGSQDNRRGR